MSTPETARETLFHDFTRWADTAEPTEIHALIMSMSDHFVATYDDPCAVCGILRRDHDPADHPHEPCGGPEQEER